METTENKNLVLAGKLNLSVQSVITADNLVGFQKAYAIATATAELKGLLTKEYMAPIMNLQGNKLGFKTDKDDKGGYSEDVVKNCLVEAVLTGVQPYGNQFNIIASNCYITKEGFGYMLANFKGLSYQVVPALPRINADKSSAAVLVSISWTLNGNTKIQDLDIPVKMNSYMGTDAVLGKATRKARAWLFNTITGNEVGDGDVDELDSKTIQITGTVINKELERIEYMITDAKGESDLKKIEKDVPMELLDLFNSKMDEVKGK